MHGVSRFFFSQFAQIIINLYKIFLLVVAKEICIQIIWTKKAVD